MREGLFLDALLSPDDRSCLCPFLNAGWGVKTVEVARTVLRRARGPRESEALGAAAETTDASFPAGPLEVAFPLDGLGPATMDRLSSE